MSRTDMSTTVQKVRRTRQINLVLLAGILILINLLGTNQFIRWDMTGRGIYSLSSASKTVTALSAEMASSALNPSAANPTLIQEFGHQKTLILSTHILTEV